MRNILIVYYYAQYPPRISVLDHLYSFQRHSGERCFYVNLAVKKIPPYLLRIPFDLIVFHTAFLSNRWHLPAYERALKRAEFLKNSSAVKVALPQDEFFFAEAVCEFINEFDIHHVFSVSPPSEWQKIYRTVDFQRVKFYQVLTGYLEDNTLERIGSLTKSTAKRDIDIGYRAWQAEPWLGRHGFIKTKVADLFTDKGPAKGLSTDISTRYEDTFLGDDWYKFLLRCKYTIGVEGGASILDWDGKVRQKTQNYMAQHPQASFEEVEAACFPGLDGSLNLLAISPRHLEACATRTCQVLIEGEYNGILTAGKHYIALERDFSNLAEVLDLVKEDSLRGKIVENAYRDVVSSGLCNYKNFISFVLKHSLKQTVSQPTSFVGMLWVWSVHRWIELTDTLSWQKVRLYWKFVWLTQKLTARLPGPVRDFLRRRRLISRFVA
jgi:hypothetical protein